MKRKNSSNSNSHLTNTSVSADNEENAKLLLGARHIVAKMSSKKWKEKSVIFALCDL